MGLTRFLLELGCEPTVILSHNANKRWQKAMKKMLDASPYGRKAKCSSTAICGTSVR
jgi:nitrogenase molybdenum-iron protein beta chain